MKVLIVDDESALLEQAEIFLPRENDSLSVETTTSGEEALQMVRSRNFDAVVSDYLLPDMDGIEILRKLREEGSGVPFIMITGRDDPEARETSLENGADRFFEKKGNPKQLYRELAETILQEVKEGE